MAKLNAPQTPGIILPVTGPLRTEATSSTTTHEGAPGFARDARSELFLRATASFAGEDAFYEKADQRVDRMRELIREIVNQPGWTANGHAREGMAWLLSFVRWLRNEGNMRTAPVMIAVEAVHERLRLSADQGGSATNRQLIDAACARLDDVTEVVACWTTWFGDKNGGRRYARAKLPIAVKKGLADAIQRLLTERSFLRYDSQDAPIRIGHVVELTHPLVTRGAWQGELYAHAIDAARGHLDRCGHPNLRAVHARRALGRLSPSKRHDVARAVLSDDERYADMMRLATASQWEWVHSWLGDDAGAKNALSKRERWQLVLPQLGYMALIRNLRNLDEAGLDDATANQLCARIADPDEVRRSRQLPFRFLSAYLNAPSLRWARALETAAQLSVDNVPELTGRTLVLVDVSGSMEHQLSRNSKVTYAMAGALFGVALALRSPGQVDLHGFASGQFKATPGRTTSLLRATEQFTAQIGTIGYGTETCQALRTGYAGHDRVVIVTDGQTFADNGRAVSMGGWGRDPKGLGALVPDHVPMYAFNLAGYRAGAFPIGTNRHELGGLTDHTFALIRQLENGRAGTWPWENHA